VLSAAARAQREQTWDVFIGHSRRNPNAVVLAEALYGHLTAEFNLTVWLDVKMDDKSEDAMEHGVRNSHTFLAIVTGPCVNPDKPEDDPSSNAYFSREYCLKELQWALDCDPSKPIQPVIRAEDKANIGALLADAPEDLKFLGKIDFIDLERNDIGYWAVGMDKIRGFLDAQPGVGSGGHGSSVSLPEIQQQVS
jgi:hypothetical protein